MYIIVYRDSEGYQCQTAYDYVTAWLYYDYITTETGVWDLSLKVLDERSGKFVDLV